MTKRSIAASLRLLITPMIAAAAIATASLPAVPQESLIVRPPPPALEEFETDVEPADGRPDGSRPHGFTTYLDFLRNKIRLADFAGFDVAESDINPILKPHQRAIVQWAVRGGCRAIFAAFGEACREKDLSPVGRVAIPASTKK